MTAVEWIVEQLAPSVSLQQKYIDELLEQAKEMEKQQIINAHNNGQCIYADITFLNESEQYYNETFNK
jgi:hypothetical protein